MKKSWDIIFNDKLPAEVQKKIKRILRPTQPDITRPQKCLFCGELTTWAVNGKPLCPKCAVKHGFLSVGWLLDPCEVCGKQGEWSTSPPRDQQQHFLCYQHRDQWFQWTIPELRFIDGRKEPEKWQQTWNEGWARFIKQQKALLQQADIPERI
jgi:hypothetical protein